MDWDEFRFFLAIARARSLTAAGKALGVSQPTVSRRLAAMEQRLGVRLFERTPRGYGLTDAGQEIFETVRGVEDALTAIDRKIFGQDRQLSGHLRITCTEVLLNHYLAPHISRFLGDHPGIDLSVIPTFEQLSLSRREADVAIRFAGRPPETLVGRRLAKAVFAVYAAADLAGTLDRARPGTWTWIGWQDESYNRRLITGPFPDARIKHRTDSIRTMQVMVRRGLGVAVLPCYLADPDPTVTRVLPDPLREESPDLWILTHPDVRQVARVRLFTDFIAQIVRADQDLFEGRRPGQGGR